MSDAPPRGTPGGECTRRPGASDTRCRCSPACTNLATRARASRRARQDAGTPGTYPARYVAARVLAVLHANPDLTVTRVAEAAGVPPRTLAVLLEQAATNPDRTVRRATATRLLSAARTVTPAPTALVDGTITLRKVEALAVAGWSIREIARAAGVSRSTLTVGNLMSVHARTRDAVDGVWAARRFTPGPTQNLRRARREGWVPAGAWANIDNPREVPDLSGLDPQWVEAILARHPDWAARPRMAG